MENIKHHIENLLSQVSVITKKYDDIAEITGENFNIFRILKMETKEVKTHSAFLAELLNPKGSHGLKDIFLKLFIEELALDSEQQRFNLIDFDTTSASAKVEFYTGKVTDIDGGRIDIIVTSGKQAIIIENKINAGDQPFQLLRYNSHNPNSALFYLTLSGYSPSTGSKGQLEENIDFKCISYENHIVSWLEKCREKAVNHSLLRETFTQYINLIKFLTGKMLNNKMEKEIFDIFKDKPHLIEAYLAFPSKRDMKIELLRQFGERIKEGLNKETKLIKSVELRFYYRPDFASIDFQVENWRDNIWLQILYDFNGEQAINPTIGIYIHDVSEEERRDESKKLRTEIDPLIKDIGTGKILSSDSGYNNWIMLHQFNKINFNNEPKIWGNLYSELGEMTEKTMIEIIDRVKDIDL